MAMPTTGAAPAVPPAQAQAVTSVPTAATSDAVAQVEPTVDSLREKRKRKCPHCGDRIDRDATRCPTCRRKITARDEQEVEEADEEWVPCPQCGAKGAERVIWTFWGSFYGPALFSHVRCPECNSTYNGRSGRSNLLPAIIFVSIPLLLIAAIIFFTVYYVIIPRRMS
jgi:DNA-directed RNA polymerase subunit RPC12/RpoP